MFAQSEQNIPHPDFSHPKKGIKRSGLNFLLKKKKKKEWSLHFHSITSEIYYRRNHLWFITYSTILEKLVHVSENSWPGTWLLTFFPEFAQTQVHWVGDAIQPSHPLLSLSPSIFPSIRVFSSEWALHIRWPKYWSFSFSPSNEYSGLISFCIDWLDLLAVQGTLKSLLQHHSSKASILRSSAFFMVQLSHQYMTPGKTIALTIWTFVSKVVSLHFNMLFRFVIAFLPRSKCLLISWLQSLSAVILEPKKVKSVTVSISICHEVMGLDPMILVFWMLNFKTGFSLSSRGSLVPLHFLPLEWCHLHIWGYWYFSWQSWFQLVIHPAQHFTWCTLHRR